MKNIKKIRIGIIGQAFMGMTHANAYIKIRYTSPDGEIYPELTAVSGQNPEKLQETAASFGINKTYTDWRELIESGEVDVIDNCGPDPLHYEVVMAALEANIPIISEKPLAITLDDCRKIAEAAEASKVVHMTCFNYRFLPAVRLAKSIIETGRLGDIYHVRARYYQSPGMSPETPADNVWYFRENRVGILQGIGSHAIDLMQYLAGDIKQVSALVKNFTPVRKMNNGESIHTDKDELTVSLLEFESGAVGTLEASGISGGHKNRNGFEIFGTKGTVNFDLEELNYLDVFLPEEQSRDTSGFTRVSVTEPFHPLRSRILPRGHVQGWEYGHVFALEHFLTCVIENRPVKPEAADLVDGYRVQRVMEAMMVSSKVGRKIDINKEFQW